MAGPLKTKENTEHDVTFAKGGTTKMFGKQAAAPETPGHTDQGDKTGPGAKYASGGSGKMFGFSPAIPASAGKTSAR